MDSVVPLIGWNVLEHNEGLKNRIRYIVEQEFGHELRVVDVGSVFKLYQADPLKLVVPFTVGIEGAIDSILRDDMLALIQRHFPSSPYIEAGVEYLPQTLKNRAEELSLGHINGAPDFLRSAVRQIYKNLSRHDYRLTMMARDIGMSQSSLERRCSQIGEHGAGHVMLRIRMAEAKRMVLETDATINEIAYAVGYDDLAIFDRAFTHLWKSSPTQLRRKAKSVREKANSLRKKAQ